MPNTAREKTKRTGRKQQQLIKRIATIVVVLAVVAGVYWILNDMVAGRPGYSVPDLKGGHTPSCTPQYNSRPPTSGCHDPSIVPYQIFDKPIDDKFQTHNLEHGGINIQYRPSGIPSEDDPLIQDLTDLINRLKNQDKRYCRLMMAPYPVGFATPSVEALKSKANSMKIALTAWNRIDLLEEFDESRIENFINSFINRGPENIDDCAK